MQNIKAALAEAVKLIKTTTDSALLDAETLLCKTLDKDRTYLRTWPDRELTPEQSSTFNHLIMQRQQGQPIAYLTGKREFWSRDFYVTPDVLIPRPETELLVELSLKLVPKGQPVKILDLGTGSGIIAITLAAERPKASIIASDTSPAALTIAQSNAAKHQLKNIEFVKSNWFNNIPETKFNLIISNPPYLAETDEHLQLGDLRFEPPNALIADGGGLADIQTIAETSLIRLESGGYLMVEHGYNQHKDVQHIFRTLHYQHINTQNDLSGQPRVTMGQYLP